MRINRSLATGLPACIVVAVSLVGAGPAMAKGGGGGGGGAPAPGAPSASCGTVTVTNNGQSAHNTAVSDIKYSVANCASSPLQGTVTFTEFAGFLSDTCPAPTADPAPVAPAAGGKVSSSAPVFRGPCGWRTSQGGPIVAGYDTWQGHNVQLTLTDASGAVLSVSYFSWQDAPSKP
jgi:hypothetical protein